MKVLILDIETAPNKVYVWSLWKQNVALNQIDEVGYTLCWAAKWLGERKTMFSAVWTDGKKEMLKKIYDLLSEADVVIHYNGTSFDIPILNQEFASEGWWPPAPFQQVDMYRVARGQFRLVSNKMDYVLKFCGLEGKVQHKGMPLWTGCMDGNAADQRTMRRYNEGDVTKLEGIYLFLKPWIKNHPNYGLYDDKGVFQCPNCGSTKLRKKGLRYTNVLTYQRWRCNDCGSWSQERYSNLDKEKRKNVLRGI